MEQIIVCYSYSGTNRKAASALSKILGCEMMEIKEKFKRPEKGLRAFLISGFQAFSGIPTEIEPFQEDFSKYDRVILFAPVWAGRIPPPVRRFLNEYREQIKRLLVISISGLGKRNRKFETDVMKALQKPPEDFIQIREDAFSTENFITEMKEYFK